MSGQRDNALAATLATVMVVSVLVGTVLFGGSVAADVEDPNVEIDVTTVDGEEYNGGDEFVAPGSEITVNYTATTDGEGTGSVEVDTVQLAFEDGGETVAVRDEPFPDQQLADKEVTVEVPEQQGYYKLNLTVVDGEGNQDEAIVDEFLAVHTEKPTVKITNPADGSVHTADNPEIDVTAYDGSGLETVEYAIRNESEWFWDGEEWTEEVAWIEIESSGQDERIDDTLGADRLNRTVDFPADGNESHFGGEYDIIVNATDGEGNALLDDVADANTPPGPEGEEQNGDAEQIGIEWIQGPPTIADTQVEDFGESVAHHDIYEVNVEVSQGDANEIGPVEVELLDGSGDRIVASELGAGEGEGWYNGTFDVAAANVTADETVTVNATARDTRWDEIDESQTNVITATEIEADLAFEQLAVEADSVDTQAEFVGVVVDHWDGVPITASGLTDMNGHEVVDGTLDLEIDDATIELDVTDGAVDESVNVPEAINASDVETGTDRTITFDTAATGSGAVINDSLELDIVHEAYNLSEGYQPAATPQAADHIVTTNVTEITTYNTSSGEFDRSLAEDIHLLAGAGYYVEGADDDARIGYDFTTDEQNVETVETTLESGWNLVGASVEIDSGEAISINDDMTETGVLSLEGDVTAYLSDNGDYRINEDPEDLVSSWDAVQEYDDEVLGGNVAYWFEIGDDGESFERTFQTSAYDPEGESE